MRRDTLSRFFRGAVVAALPLLHAGCGSGIGIPPCGGGGAVTFDVDGGLGDGGCTAKCAGGGILSAMCTEKTDSHGQTFTECSGNRPCLGRRPEGLVAATSAAPSVLGRHFALAAHLEAASVPAFRRLRAELRAHGAPRRLLDACSRAARDEIRHARGAARLARRFGGARPPVEVPRARRRDLKALALDNAREGCVGESFGALVATWQARSAADTEVRAHLRAIAADETRHAELAWAIDAWARTRLSAADRAELAAARAAEVERLAAGLDVPVDAELQRAAGLPPPAVAAALHRAFAAEIARRA